MRRILAFSLAAVANLAIFGTAHAQMVTADPSAIAKLLQDAGYRAEMAKNSAGDPMIRSASSGIGFVIYFYGCKNHADCASIQFHVGYSGLKNVTISALNDWNGRKRYGRAYQASNGNVLLEMDFNLRQGGISPALFRDNFGVWVQLMAEFDPYVKGK